MSPRPKQCSHPAFVVHASVTRETQTPGGAVTGYACDVRVRCDQCGEHFTWLGLPGGVHPTKPTVSVDGRELRGHLAPASAKQDPLSQLGYPDAREVH